jgi:hypothetical protein
MTSSISSSDSIPVADTAAEWRRWLVAFLSVPVIGACVILAFLIAVDPYDTGKFGLLSIDGVDDQNTVTAIPSRARDLQFDSAVIGNSTVQRLNPTELSQATGLRFVQLYKIGATPREVLTILDLFMRKHPHPRALVIGADPYWCTHGREEPAQNLPYWLYDQSFFEYAVRLISWRSIEHAFQRISIGLGHRQRAVVDGFFNYEEIWPPGLFRDTARPADPVPAATAAEREVFPAIARLDAAIKNIPSDVPIILFVPPTLASTVPQPGSVEATEREACNAALARTVADRPHSRFINYRVDNALTRNPDDFADYIHYRGAIAEKITQGIIASLRLGPDAKIEF